MILAITISIILFILCVSVRIYKSNNDINIFDPIYYLLSLIFFYLIISFFNPINDSLFDNKVYFLSQHAINVFLLLIFIYILLTKPLTFSHENIKIKSKNYFYSMSLLLLIIGYFFLFFNYYRIFIFGDNIDIEFFSRINRNYLLSSLPFNFPYTNFLFLSFVLLFFSEINIKQNYKTFIIKIIPYIPIIIFYLIDGERSSIIKIILSLFFILPFIYPRIKKRINFKFILITILLFIFFSFIGNIRSSLHIALYSKDFSFVSDRILQLRLINIIPKEFSSTRFTIDYAVFNNISKRNNRDNLIPLYGTYLQSLEYFFPRSFYKFIGINKTQSISDTFGSEYAELIGRERNLSFGMSGLGEAIFNFGFFGILLFGAIVLSVIDLIKKNLEKRQTIRSILTISILSPVPLFLFRNSFVSSANYLFQCLIIISSLFLLQYIIKKFIFYIKNYEQ